MNPQRARQPGMLGTIRSLGRLGPVGVPSTGWAGVQGNGRG